MRKMKEIYWNSVRRVSSAKETLSRSVDNRVKGGVDGYIVAALLIVIAVVVGAAVKDPISDFVTGLIGDAQTEASSWF